MFRSLKTKNYINTPKIHLYMSKKKNPKKINSTSMSQRTLCYSTASTTPIKQRTMLVEQPGDPTFLAVDPLVMSLLLKMLP